MIKQISSFHRILGMGWADSCLAKSGGKEVSDRARDFQEKRGRNHKDNFKFLSLCWSHAALIARHNI